MQGRRRFGRRGEHGQVIPIVALLALVITGFAAISLDTGMAYAQSRGDNDISDAAALAGAYGVTDSQPGSAGTSLLWLYTAEQNAANADGCNAGQCQAPAITSGSNTYLVAEVWTVNAFNSTSHPTPNIYVGSAGTCSTSASGTFAVGTCPAASAILDVGAPVSDKTTDYFAAVVGGHPVGITPNAVAQVGGSGGGSVSTNPQLACEVCILQNVIFGSSSSSALQTSGGNLAIGGYVEASNPGTDTIQTSNGYGIDVVGATQYLSSTLYFNDSSGATVNSAGNLGITGNVLNAGGGNVTLTAGGTFNVTGSVTHTGSGSISESPTPGNSTTPAFKDPYAAAPTPLPTVSGTPVAWSTTTQGGCASSENVPAGLYTSITDNCSGAVTLNFSGQYVLEGTSGSTVGLELDGPGSVTLAGTATFYLTCSTGSCGGWTASPTPTCAATKAGTQVVFNDSSGETVNLAPSEDGLVFFFDPCNSNADAFYLESGGSVTDSGTGGIWAHSGVMYLGSSNSMALPGPIVVSTLNLAGSGGGTLATNSGSINFTPSSATGNLVN
jgi:hypothetical protein